MPSDQTPSPGSRLTTAVVQEPAKPQKRPLEAEPDASDSAPDKRPRRGPSEERAAQAADSSGSDSGGAVSAGARAQPGATDNETSSADVVPGRSGSVERASRLARRGSQGVKQAAAAGLSAAADAAAVSSRSAAQPRGVLASELSVDELLAEVQRRVTPQFAPDLMSNYAWEQDPAAELRKLGAVRHPRSVQTELVHVERCCACESAPARHRAVVPMALPFRTNFKRGQPMALPFRTNFRRGQRVPLT